jgi:hypothetical protein
MFTVLDHETVDDIRGSRFFTKEFAALSESTVTADHGRTWTGVYAYGKHTYIELFTASRKWKLGDWGIGLGVEEPGGIDVVYQRLKAKFRNTVRMSLSKRSIDGKLIPWFRSVNFKSSYKQAPHVWTMEYVKTYMDSQKPASANMGDEISRERYLRPMFDERRHLLDIVGATLALDSVETKPFLKVAASLGYEVRPIDQGHVCKSLGFSFTVVPKTKSRSGIQEVKMVLQRPIAKATTLHFGSKSTLELRENKAVWTF